MTTLTWDTATEWDAAASQQNVHHEQPAGTDWAASDTVELGYPTSIFTALFTYNPLDSIGDGTADEVAGSGATGTNSGCAAGTGVLGTNGARFDSTADDQIQYDANPCPATSTWRDGSISCFFWFKRDATALTNSPGGDEAFITFQDGASADNYNCQIGIEDMNNEVKVWADNSDMITGATQGVNDGAWHSVAVTKNSSAVDTTAAELYLDGANDVASKSGRQFDNAHPEPTRIGHGNGGETRALTEGNLSDMMIFDRELSASEVSTLHSITSNGSLISAEKVS